MKCTVSRRRRSFRKSAMRGAAMVECAVVMPVIVLFYGLNIFFYRGFDLKETLMARTRHSVFSDSLHGCPQSNSAALGLERVPAYPTSASGYESAITGGAHMDSFRSGRGMKTRATASGTATNAPLSTIVYTSKIEAASQVYCVQRSGDPVLGAGQDVLPVARREGLSLVQTVMGGLVRRLDGLLQPF